MGPGDEKRGALYAGMRAREIKQQGRRNRGIKV